MINRVELVLDEVSFDSFLLTGGIRHYHAETDTHFAVTFSDDVQEQIDCLVAGEEVTRLDVTAFEDDQLAQMISEALSELEKRGYRVTTLAEQLDLPPTPDEPHYEKRYTTSLTKNYVTSREESYE